MPKALENKLKAEAGKHNWSEKRKDAYVYGTLRKTGWKPSTQKKGSEYSNKHASSHAKTECMGMVMHGKHMACK